MAAKERHKQKVKQRIQDRLNGILSQEEALHSLIRNYVQQAQTRTEELLAIEDTGYFMLQYGSVEQLLDKINNTCELLSTTAEDMIENSESDVTIQPDITMSSFSDTVTVNKQLEISAGDTHSYRQIDPKTSTPDRSGAQKQRETVENNLHEDSKETNAIMNTDHKASTLEKQGKLKKDEEIEKELKAILHSTNKEPVKHQQVSSDKKTLHQQNSCDNFEITLGAQTSTKQAVTCLDRGAKPKHSKSIIPSPVKKSIATYIQTDEEIINTNVGDHAIKGESSDTYRNTSIPRDKGKNSTTLAEKSDKNGILAPELRDNLANMVAEKSLPNVGETDKFKPVKVSSKTSLYLSDSSFHTHDGDTDYSDRTVSSQSIQNNSQDVSSKSGSHIEKNRCDSTSSKEEETRETVMLEQSSLLSGKITPVIVSDIDTPWCFCVQINAVQVNHLMEQICTYMSVHGMQEEPLVNPKRGQMCLARFSKDMTFYRAYIMQYHEASKEAEVLYVDYGNRERVKTVYLRKLPESFYAIPMQAICCSLAEVMPNNKYMLWTEDETLVFKQYVMNQHLNCVQACKCSNPEVPVIVRLIRNYPVPSLAGGHLVLNQLSIGEVLVNRGSAKYVNTVDQVGLLEKSGEGRKESLILNKSGGHGKVVEIEDGQSVPSIDHIVEKRTKTGKKLCKIDTGESLKTSKTGIRDTKISRDKKEGDHCIIAKENSDKNNKSKPSTDRYGESFEQKKKGKSPQKITVKDTAEEAVERSHKKHGRDTDLSDRIETTDTFQKHIKKEQVTTEDRENTILTNSLETDKHNQVINVIECQDVKGYSLSADEKRNETCMQELGNSKGIPEKISEKIAHVDCEIMSSTGTTDMDSERSTDTGFQSTEVTFDLQLNPKGEEVMLAHVQSPSHFYVHMLQVGRTLHLLMKSLNKHFEKMNRRKLTRLSQTFVPVVNKLCCTQFLQDNNFYRAVIVNIRSDNEVGVGKVRVHYIDFGDDEWLPKRRLFPLPPHYASLPPLAIKCKLAYIKPANANDCVKADGDEFKWSDCATKAFKDLMGFEKTLHMLVVEGNLTSDCKGELVGGNEETLGVYLVDTNGTEEVCANMDLIRLNHAVLDVPDVWNINEQDPCDETALMDWNPMEADFLSKRNSYKVDTEDAEMATVGYKSKDHKGICRYFSKGANCWKGDNCPFRHVRTDSAVPLGREEVYCTDNQMEALPEVKSWVAAEVITILTPGHFYILLPMGNKSLDGACDDSAQDENANIQCNESLDDLLTALNVEYNKKSPNDRTLQLKAPGELVVARYSQDKQWYRARVIQVTDDRVKVFYLDFGNTEWLPDEEIAEIMPEFLHLPFQAFECFLCGVEPTGDENWTTESKNAFRSLVDGKTLVAHIRSRSWNGCLFVDLYDTSETDDINIAEKLIENNHAARCSFLTDSSCNGSVVGQSPRTNSEKSEIIMVPG